tara:strand:+ start:50 stop:319 length:270 start_codon:yes stop_codon:yes gene_type:complete
MENKDKTEPEEKITEEQVILADLSSLEARNLMHLYTAVTKSNINKFVSQETGKLLSGSEKALFSLGTVVGSNDILIKLKAILNNGSNAK